MATNDQKLDNLWEVSTHEIGPHKRVDVKANVSFNYPGLAAFMKELAVALCWMAGDDVSRGYLADLVRQGGGQSPDQHEARNLDTKSNPV